jgi:enhancing lycopene biosynthesis protein 2
MGKRIAVVLCGSGFKDGSEIRESVGVLWALSEHRDLEVQCFALDEPQRDVVNCLTGQVVPGETRNQLVESARIARGQVQPLITLDVAKFDAIILPGGFGAAKNLCDFALKGEGAEVHPVVKEKLRAFRAAAKPIGAVCIAPAVLALAFKGQGLELTVGEKSDASSKIEALGHRHHEKKPDEICVDAKNKVVSTPAYMHDKASLADIFRGVRQLVDRVVELA